MNRDDVFGLAREAGMTQLMGQTFHGHAMTPDVLMRFATLVATHAAKRPDGACESSTPSANRPDDACPRHMCGLIGGCAARHPSAPSIELVAERTARQAAQRQLADLQELQSKSGLAERRVVHEAVAAERKRITQWLQAQAEQKRRCYTATNDNAYLEASDVLDFAIREISRGQS